jgi:hypothetical protein
VLRVAFINKPVSWGNMRIVGRCEYFQIETKKLIDNTKKIKLSVT